ncbi:3-hexulose-6-phosphate synthase [Psychrobacillus sp. FJAT-51614]|uniref:3-hexulose-6-phosphate synthase n=1 Tax=Psychrobacillus mangrovi TaxID=3117745 RepID=A0ABU8F1P4_9BACI
MKKFKIQLALDRMTIDESIKLIKQTKDYVDWIEIGTSIIKDYGMSALREIRGHFPKSVIVADMKTCDAGIYECLQAFGAGANITTVMGFATNKTIEQSLKVAAEKHGEVMIDLLGIEDSIRVREIYSLGARLFCLHVGKDMQKSGEVASYSLFNLVEGLENIQVAVAGGINLETAPELIKAGADLLVVGGYLTNSKFPKESAKKLAQLNQNTFDS